MRTVLSVSLAALLLCGAPAARAAFNSPQTDPVADVKPGERECVLGEGETLWDIARRFNIPVKDIKQANSFADPDHVAAGTTVKVPADPIAVLRWEQRQAEKPAPRPVPSAAASDDADDESPDAALLYTAHVKGPRKMGGQKVDARHPFRWPVAGHIISGYGKRRGHRRAHQGIDIGAPEGSLIHATMAGHVIFSGRVRGYGNVVVLDHENGYYSVYGHNKHNMVKCHGNDGPEVAAGQVIAVVGHTGNATTPHVHFEIRRDDRPVNPIKVLAVRTASIPYELAKSDE